MPTLPVLVALLATAPAPEVGPPVVPGKVDGFEARTGVRLVLDEVGGSVDGLRVEPLDPRQAGRAEALAARVAAAWPVDVLAGAVDEVRFVGGVDAPGGELGGLARCESRSLLVRLDGHMLDAGVLRTLHHELGHLVHCGIALDEAAWTAGQDVRYADGLAAWSRYAGRHLAELVADPSLASPYAAASLEEDVAETFALAMGSPDALAAVLQAKPELARKLGVLEQAVQARWPAFTFGAPVAVAAR